MANVPITVGNRPPVITIEFPKDGQVASFTDKVNYKISVTDPEDGTTGSGISCNDVRVDVALGHDEHSHTLSSTTGCTGTFNTGLTSGPRRRGQHLHGARRVLHRQGRQPALRP